MKRSKKWFIACLTLSALVVPYLLTSSDVNAKKYDIQKIPITFPYNGSLNPNWRTGSTFEIYISDDIDLNNYKDIYGQYALQLTEDVNHNYECHANYYDYFPVVTYDVSNMGPNFQNMNKLSYGFQGYENDPPFQIDHCFKNGAMSSYSTSSVSGLADGDPRLSNTLLSLLPYRFAYDGFYRHDTRKDDNGINFTTKFGLDDLFRDNKMPNRIGAMYIPFGSGKSDVSDTLTNDTPVKFDGEFVIDWDDPSTPAGFTSNTVFKLETYYIIDQGYMGPDISDCTWDYYHKDSDEEGIYTLHYTCSTTLRDSEHWDPADSFPYFRLRFIPDYSTSNTKFYQFFYDASIVVTNNDYSSGGSWDDPVQGSNPHYAPGSAYQFEANHPDSSTPDWLASLTDMFSFTFINPFAGIFNLFIDQNSCQQIPIIAGMIHSQETQVCPWFSANTRNIVTPVLGIASVMLVFGFAVRWLGARSGNFFEDSGSGGGDIGSVHVGRSKK